MIPNSTTKKAPVTFCPICCSADLLYHNNNLTLCQNCQHIFQSDLCVTQVYNASYAHQYDTLPHQELSSIRWNFLQDLLCLPKGSKILDIGYGNGSFLRYARQQGMEIYGIDLHNENFDIPNIQFNTNIEFDLVCFFDSLEHFDEFSKPLSLKTKNVILSIPDTISFILQTPTIWRHYKPGEHLHYFSRKSLDLIMNRWGLTYKISQDHPEDILRGKLTYGSEVFDNIYTAVYSTQERPRS